MTFWRCKCIPSINKWSQPCEFGLGEFLRPAAAWRRLCRRARSKAWVDLGVAVLVASIGWEDDLTYWKWEHFHSWAFPILKTRHLNVCVYVSIYYIIYTTTTTHIWVIWSHFSAYHRQILLDIHFWPTIRMATPTVAEAKSPNKNGWWSVAKFKKTMLWKR